MKWSIVKNSVIAAYDDLVDELRGTWPGKPLPGYQKAVQHRSKYMSCGKLLPATNGHEVYHWCRRPVCPNCATYWGRKLARSLLKACPSAAKNDFRMVTLVWGLVPDAEAAFTLFKAKRRALGNAVDYRRRATGSDRAGWLVFGVAGALEVDCFQGEDFKALGTAKQQQYRDLGFVPSTTGPQWVATTHALVHVGKLGENAVKALFEGLAPVVHIQDLREDQTLSEAAEGVVGYGAKVEIETEFALKETRPWSLDVLKSYIAATMQCSHGRQGFRLLINPKKERKKTTAPIKDVDVDDFMGAMPVVV